MFTGVDPWPDSSMFLLRKSHLLKYSKATLRGSQTCGPFIACQWQCVQTSLELEVFPDGSTYSGQYMKKGWLGHMLTARVNFELAKDIRAPNTEAELSC